MPYIVDKTAVPPSEVGPPHKPSAWLEPTALTMLAKGSPRVRLTTELRKTPSNYDVPLYDQAALDAAVAAERERHTDLADAARVLAWAREKPRRPANTAFTAGAERQAAYWIEWAEAEERERCSKVCEEVAWLNKHSKTIAAIPISEAEKCAKAIRNG